MQQPLIFTYFLGGDLAFEALTWIERPDAPMDVLTFYYDDPEMLNTQECADAIDFRDMNEILDHSDDHRDDLHRPDAPMNVHAHIKKPRSEMMDVVEALFGIYLSTDVADQHAGQLKAALRHLKHNPDVPGFTFDSRGDAFVHSITCKNIKQDRPVDRHNFASVPLERALRLSCK